MLEKELGYGRTATRFGDSSVLTGDAMTVSLDGRTIDAGDVRTVDSRDGRTECQNAGSRTVNARDDVWDEALHVRRAVALEHDRVAVVAAVMAGSAEPALIDSPALLLSRAETALVGSTVVALDARAAAAVVSGAGGLVHIHGTRDVQLEVDGARADVVPQGQTLVTGRAAHRRGSDHAEAMPRVERAVHRLREQRAKRVQVEVTLVAAVHEARRGAVLPAEVANVRDTVAARGADELEAVLIREEGDELLEVIGARLVDVDAAVVAAVAGEAGDLEEADVACVGGRVVVFRLGEEMIWVDEVF